MDRRVEPGDDPVYPSRDLLGLAQALDERSAQEKFSRQLRIFRRAAKLVVIASAHLRIAFFQQALVADRLRLGVLHRNMAALPFVAVKLALLSLASEDADELVGEIECIVHAAVEPHAA